MGSHDDHDTERDPMIARALGQVPVPPRPADFLDRLDDALDAVDEERHTPRPAAPAASAPRTQPGATVPVDLTDPKTEVTDLAGRRHAKAGRRYRILAAAASVAVILGGVAVLTRDDGTTTTVEPAGETPGTGDPAQAADAAREAALRGAMDAVMTWSKAVSDGDSERAWSLMGPLSHRYLTASDAWDDMKVTLGEGSFGRWHRVGLPAGYSADGAPLESIAGENEDGSTVRAAFLPGTDDAVVVTLTGVFELEGNREEVLDAFPLTREGDGPWQIEPFAFGPGETLPEFVMPGLAAGGGLDDVERGFTLEVAGMGAEQVAVQVWAEDRQDVKVADGTFQPMTETGQDRWTYQGASNLPAGSLHLVVVARGADFITAHPVELFVKGDQPTSCPNIGFTPNSDDAAGDITIVGADCAEAERVIRHVHEDLKHSFFDGPRYFTALGYECTVRTESEGLESGLYRCVDGATLIQWSKT
jgi:hypothetical protein